MFDLLMAIAPSQPHRTHFSSVSEALFKSRRSVKWSLHSWNICSELIFCVSWRKRSDMSACLARFEEVSHGWLECNFSDLHLDILFAFRQSENSVCYLKRCCGRRKAEDAGCLQWATVITHIKTTLKPKSGVRAVSHSLGLCKNGRLSLSFTLGVGQKALDRFFSPTAAPTFLW